MPVTINVLNGALKGDTYRFREPTECLVGCAVDCTIKVPETGPKVDVSKHHCFLEIDPPYIWLTDLGSQTGTFLNDRRVKSSKDTLELVKNGDVIRTGLLELFVKIHDEVNEEELEGSESQSIWIQ